MPHSPGIGAIFGIVSENGIAKAGGRVGLYDRTTMLLINKTVADALGGYVFTGLNQVTNDYLLMALDDDGSPAKNALVQDYVQPIPAHMGAVAYSNWSLRARRNDPFFMWVPRFQDSVPTIFETMGAGGYHAAFAATFGSYQINQPTITINGAPHYPSLKLSTGALQLPVFHTQYMWPFVGTATEYFSLEFVIDTTFDAQVTPTGYVLSGNARSAPMAGMSWNAATKLVQIATTAAVFNPNFTLNLADTQNYRMNSYTATGLAPGVHHFVMTSVLGLNQKLYIDGVLVFTASLSGTNSAFIPSNWGSIVTECYVYVSGLAGNLGLGRFGPMAAYHVALSDTEVNNLYRDLLVGTTPLSSGYVREILTDDPALLYRLNESTFGAATEFLTGKASATHYGVMSFSLPSPVVGGSMTKFGGGGARALRGSGFGSQTQRSWEFWVNPDTAAPSATRTLFCAHDSSDGVGIGAFWWKVQQVQTSGTLRLSFNDVGATETINFVYTMPAGVIHHMVLTVDKAVGVCKLYVDGNLQETQVITGTLFNGGYGATDPTGVYSTLVTLGGFISSTITFTEMFFGALSEVAVYYKLLAPDRIKAHYDARLLI
jgi:hypothetical protein